MRALRDFHHYKDGHIPNTDRISRLERAVAETILGSTLTEDERESSAIFEFKHSSGITQFARLLAVRRSLDVDICAAGAVLHDIYVIVHGKYKNHAVLGGPIALELAKSNGFSSSAETELILNIVTNHSDKHLISDNPYIEFGKDVDVLDCFLYPNAIEYYLKHKPLYQMFHYLRRAQSLWSDLGMTSPPALHLLDNYTRPWLDTRVDLTPQTIVQLLTTLASSGARAPSFLLQVRNGACLTSFNQHDLARVMGPDHAGDFGRVLKNNLAGHDRGARDIELLIRYLSDLGIGLTEDLNAMIWAPIQVIETVDASGKGAQRIEELTR
jgi:HD domain